MLHSRPMGPSIPMLLLVMGIGVTPSCKPAAAPRQELPSYCYDEKALGDELVHCAQTKPTKAESQACRANVHSTCGYKVPETGDAR